VDGGVTSRSRTSRPSETAATFTGAAAVALRRSVTATVFVIASLTFAFGFGNGRDVGIQLGVPGWIAPLVAPAVDLSVVALLAALQYLRASGVEGRLIGPRLLLVFCGLTTLAINTVESIAAGAIGRACFDGVAPLLLIGWSEVGPKLLASLMGTVPGPSRTSRDESPVISVDLVERARRLDAKAREQGGRPITRDKLRGALRVSNAVAGELLRQMRAEAQAR
jgi:Protein of unknown function (DUF2637)